MYRSHTELALMASRRRLAGIFGLPQSRHYRKRHPLDCGHTACYACHPEKHCQRIPTRQEQHGRSNGQMNVYKLEVLIVDHDDVGEAEIRNLLENGRYPNHCLSPQVKACETRTVAWSDDHPLNHSATCEQAYRELFCTAVDQPAPENVARICLYCGTHSLHTPDCPVCGTATVEWP